MKLPVMKCQELPNELLLAWLEGQDSFFWSWRIRRHMYRCWSCRNRAAQLEEAIQAVQQELSGIDCDPREIETARWRFWQAVHASSSNADPLERPRGRRPYLSWAAAFAIAASVTVLVRWRTEAPSSGENPLTAIHAFERMEDEGFQSSIRQLTYRIDISAPGHPAVKRLWERWSAPKHKAFKSVWSDEEGRVRSVLFSGQLQDTASSENLWDAVRLCLSGKVNPEAAVLEWAGKQLWQPVSMAHELAEFQARTGALLRIERSGNGSAISAAQVIGGIRVSMRMLANSDGAVPRLLQISWQQGAGNEVIRVVREKDVIYTDFSLVKRAFEPSPILDRDKAFRPRASAVPAQKSGSVDLGAARVEAFEVIHHLALCMQQTLQVTEEGGHVEVSGFVPDAATRNLLTESLQASALGGSIRSHVELPDLAHLPPAIQPPQRQITGEMQAAPVERWFREQFRGERPMTEREVFGIMNRAISLATVIAAQSSAMRRLGKEFSTAQEASLPLAYRARLLTMVNDHFSPILRAAAELQEVLESLFPHSAALPPATQSEPGAANWQEDAVTMQARARVISNRIIDLFSSHANPGGPVSLDRVAAELYQLTADLKLEVLFANSVQVQLNQSIADCDRPPLTPGTEAISSGRLRLK